MSVRFGAFKQYNTRPNPEGDFQTMPDEGPLIEFQVRGRITLGTVRSSSVLSARNVAIFGADVLDYVKKHPGLNLLLNFENVDYLSSAVLTELLKIRAAIEEVKGNLRLCAVSPVIHKAFEITNLDKMFVIHSDRAEADVKRFERALDIAAQEASWDKL